MCGLHAGPRVAGQTLLDLDAVTLQTPDGRATLVQNLSVQVGTNFDKFADGLITTMKMKRIMIVRKIDAFPALVELSVCADTSLVGAC